MNRATIHPRVINRKVRKRGKPPFPSDFKMIAAGVISQKGIRARERTR